ncbi:hypothetical protein Dimus_002487 [Dionaea muscipula]
MVGKREWPAAIGNLTAGAVRAVTSATNYAHGGGVGLGIVVALCESAAGSPRGGGEYPIPVNSPNNLGRIRDYCNAENWENYTYVTCRGPDKSVSVTRVYYDGIDFDRKSIASVAGDFHEFCASEFLKWCLLCRKPLHGKDIFMYRGDKAFCSGECRERKIVMDERKEQRRSKASRLSADRESRSSSSYSTSRGQIFSAGIVAV